MQKGRRYLVYRVDFEDVIFLTRSVHVRRTYGCRSAWRNVEKSCGVMDTCVWFAKSGWSISGVRLGHFSINFR